MLAGGASPALALPPVELSGVAAGTGGFVMNGAAAGDEAGRRVSDAGDVNGDGLPDLIIGAPEADPSGTYSGRAYLVFGRTATVPVELSAVPGASGFVINGAAANDRAGESVSAAGDVNGDGLADVLIGAPGLGLSSNRQGRSYVVFGKADTAPVALAGLAFGFGGFVIIGENTSDQAAIVSAAGDVNGDGIADLIVGAPGADPNGGESGRSYVVFGKTDAFPVFLSSMTAGVGGFAINGEAAEDYSGLSVSGAGDVNGDGLADLIVGAPRRDVVIENEGRSYVIFGKRGTAPVNLSAVAGGAGGFAINGAAAHDDSGASVAGAGDVNGDGLADLLVGATLAHFNTGSAYVVFGKTGPTPVQLSAVEAGAGGFVMNGQGGLDRCGSSVSPARDVNGDGLADVFVGAYSGNPNGNDSGRGYVVFGKTGTAAINLSGIGAGTAGFGVHGQATGDNAGVSVSRAGDMNGDGLEDLVIGARLADPNGDRSGKAYLAFSPPAAPAPPPAGVAASATYRAYTRAGDGPGGAPVIPTVVPDVLNDSRATIDYADDDAGSGPLGAASLETVTLRRSDSGVSGLAPPGEVANVVWEISTDRAGWASAEVTFRYTDAELGSSSEESFRLWQAPALEGPWIELPTILAPERNQARAATTSFGVFALVGDPPNAAAPDTFDKYQ